MTQEPEPRLPKLGLLRSLWNVCSIISLWDWQKLSESALSLMARHDFNSASSLFLYECQFPLNLTVCFLTTLLLAFEFSVRPAASEWCGM